jgi:hypothetical protein
MSVAASAAKRKGSGSRSFLKKRTKRLLLFDAIHDVSAMAWNYAQAQRQSLLVLFFRKERLPEAAPAFAAKGRMALG